MLVRHMGRAAWLWVAMALLGPAIISGGLSAQDADPDEVRERDPEPESAKAREARRLYQDFFERTLATVSETPLEAGPKGYRSRSAVVALKPPIDPKLVKGLLKHEDRPGEKKVASIFAYIAADFDLISHFSDEQPRGIAHVRPGEKVEVVFIIKEPTENEFGRFHWCLVRRASGEEGYIPDSLLRSSVKKERSNWSSLPLPAKMVVRVGSSLMMRDAPSLDGNPISSLFDGQKVLVTRWASEEENVEGERGRWARVKTEYGIEGFVFAAYLRPEEDSPTEKPETFSVGDTKFVRSPVLRVREEPSSYGIAIALLPNSTPVRVLEVSDQKLTVVGISAPWVKIQAGDEEGWVFGGFLSKRKGAYISYDNIYRPFVHPTGDYRRVTSKYGPRVHPVLKVVKTHTGIDIAAPSGAPIRAPADGVVYRTSYHGAYGKLTIIEHSGDLFTWFAHQRKFRVRKGQKVSSGQLIGEVGKTGRVTGAHLHFEVRKGNRQTMDPAIFIPR